MKISDFNYMCNYGFISTTVSLSYTDSNKSYAYNIGVDKYNFKFGSNIDTTDGNTTVSDYVQTNVNWLIPAIVVIVIPECIGALPTIAPLFAY